MPGRRTRFVEHITGRPYELPPRSSLRAVWCWMVGHKPGPVFWRITGAVSSTECVCERCGARA